MAPRVIRGIQELRALIGSEVGVSDWLEMTQDRINKFADVTGDHQWIHVDEERATTSPFGRTIAHGFLTLSLISHFAAESVKVEGNFRMGINYGLNKLRFPSPVPCGSRLRAHFSLQSVEDVDGGHQITWAVTVEVEGQTKPSLAAEWLVRYYY
ncbi:MAG TPA: MaoC family dehydratase [Blastocatellia bacterium]|nr:MaoC family dehydratase [Blastocatellia bacterium]